MRIEGKVVLITGGSRGIGAACADSFRRRGARLSLVARCEEKLRAVGRDDALITPGDITEDETRRRVVDRTLERFGAIDILINNAGMGMYSPAWCAPMAGARRLFELNLFAPLEMIQLVVPHMQRQRGGMLVNVGSIAGKVTLPWFTLYSVTKFGLGSLTDGLRMELKRWGIHAMMVCPGYVNTDFQLHAIGSRPPDLVVRGKQLAITAHRCAEDIARGVERDARTVVTPGIGWIFIGLARLLPRVADAQISAVNKKHAPA